MNAMGWWARGAALALALATSLAACGNGGSNQDVLTLHRGNGAEPLSLDPHKASGAWENTIISDMFLGLFTVDEGAEPIPGMADSWSVSEDGLIWTFILRDVSWSDGTPVTARDFEASFRRILNPETLSQYAALLYLIEGAEEAHAEGAPLSEIGVRAVDDRTLEIRLDYPAPYLPEMLTHYTTFPVPAHVVADHGDAWIQPENIEVNGPFKLVEWRTNDFVAVEKNPLFYDADNVCYDEVVYYPTVDPASAERRVRSGELDLNEGFPGQKIDFLRQEIPDYVNLSPGLVTTYLSFNTEISPFDDVRVRSALAMTVDVDFIITEILRAGQRPAVGLVPPGIANYEPGAAVSWAGQAYDARQAQARALLEDAGFGPDNPLRFTYSYRNSGDNPRVAPVMQDGWRRIADWVEVELRPTEVQIHYANLRTGDFTVGDGGWLADYNDPQNFLFLLTTENAEQNYSRWSNARYDALMDESNRELDRLRRASLLREAEALMLADAPIAPLWHGVNKSLVSPQITGWRENASGVNLSRYLCPVVAADNSAEGSVDS